MVVSAAAIFLIVCFALDLIDANYKSLVKSSENQLVECMKSQDSIHAIAFGGLNFHSRSIVFGLDEAQW